MTVEMKLEAMPQWIPSDDRHCRACDKQTDYVIVAVGTRYTYPCCATDRCKQIVCEQITQSLTRATA